MAILSVSTSGEVNTQQIPGLTVRVLANGNMKTWREGGLITMFPKAPSAAAATPGAGVWGLSQTLVFSWRTWSRCSVACGGCCGRMGRSG